MKILNLAFIGFAALLMTACGDDNKATENPDSAAATSNEKALQQAVADRDELVSLITEINDSVARIKYYEKIVTVDQGESPNRRAQILADIEAIRQTISQREARLLELEQKLQSSSVYSQSLQNTIATLKGQIAQHEKDIASLNAELGAARETIKEQTAQIDTLNTTVQTVSNDLALSQQSNVELKNDMNRCYYIIGTGKELKAAKVMESGFLRKTKIMEGDFEQSAFTTADRRTLRSIPLNSKKADVKTKQPKDSYTIETDANGLKTLKIIDPDKFWRQSNYLVVEI